MKVKHQPTSVNKGSNLFRLWLIWNVKGEDFLNRLFCLTVREQDEPSEWA